MDTKQSEPVGGFEPETKLAYESHSSVLALGSGGRLFVSASTYSASVVISVSSAVASTVFRLDATEARSVAAELLAACDAAEAATQKVAA